MSLKTAAIMLVAVAISFSDAQIQNFAQDPTFKHEPLPYYYNYDIHDPYKQTHYGQHEKSDGKAVYGSYTVALPDGRTQKVEYTADHHKGYVAKVSYYGKAKHPRDYGRPFTFFQTP